MKLCERIEKLKRPSLEFQKFLHSRVKERKKKTVNKIEVLAIRAV